MTENENMAEAKRIWEFRTLAGDVVATYDGEFDKLTEAANETARLLGVALAVFEVTEQA